VWLPAWLPLLDGRRTLAEALASLPEERRAAAREIVERLYGERVLIDGPVASALVPAPFAVVLEGEGLLYRELTSSCQSATAPTYPRLPVLCQDKLDYDEALRFNRRCLEGDTPWLWVSAAALSRGYVSPLFLPDAGPCLHCLLNHFQRRSPMPELYADLIEHARKGELIAPTPAGGRAIAMLAHLLLWKAEIARDANPPAVLFRLHVLDAATMEIASYRVFVDPDCPTCAGRR
jgi:bacteriocin biosynthesis cyclodehydratase domain-containing protein